MAETPTREFGKRRPVAIEPAAPVKRSGHVALLLMGSFAVGGAAYALIPSENCAPQPGMASDLQSNAACPPRRSTSSGSGGRGSAPLHMNFFNGDSSSGRTSSATSSDSSSGGVTRGGFGSFAQAFASHFSRGG
jgi:hypothetical protein